MYDTNSKFKDLPPWDRHLHVGGDVMQGRGLVDRFYRIYSRKDRPLVPLQLRHVTIKSPSRPFFSYSASDLHGLTFNGFFSEPSLHDCVSFAPLSSPTCLNSPVCCNEFESARWINLHWGLGLITYGLLGGMGLLLSIAGLEGRVVVEYS